MQHRSIAIAVTVGTVALVGVGFTVADARGTSQDDVLPSLPSTTVDHITVAQTVASTSVPTSSTVASTTPPGPTSTTGVTVTTTQLSVPTSVDDDDDDDDDDIEVEVEVEDHGDRRGVEADDDHSGPGHGGTDTHEDRSGHRNGGDD